jgi:chemotaxis protein MotB
MKNISTPRHHASLSIEELVEEASPQQQNWLLTYLDVFVLIIMLVVTLMALSDLKVEQNPSKIKPTTVNATKTQEKEDITEISEEESITIPSQKLEATDPIDQVTPTKEIKPKQDEEVPDTDLQDELNETIAALGLSDKISMKVTSDFAELEIQDKILFQSSEAGLLDEGKVLLEKISPILDQSLGSIDIEGHTDNIPIETISFPSNWELGAVRATNVLHYLVTQDIEPSRLRAITSGETRPIADNSTELGREKYRRVSIVIQVKDKAQK